MRRALLTALSAAGLAAAAPALAQQGDGAPSAPGDGSGFTTAARAVVQNREGTDIGTVTINTTESGVPLVIVAISDLPEGAHGIHLHQTGDCSAEDFSSAGGHIAGDAQHGVFVSGGPHPGDLPNAIVGSEGDLNLEIFNPRINVEEMILDEDGSAFVVHANADDYVSQPSGNSGDRIACGEFVAG